MDYSAIAAIIVVSIIVIAIVFAVPIIPMKIAQSKGSKKSFLWYMYGLLFFLAAVLHALLMKEDKEYVEKQEIDAGKMKRCCFCAEIIRKEAKVCRYCGREEV
ncbi:zinc ribbon domain-containing protein [Anaplasmataceae bacterium AB001_6]|nr:zinc ribbon domain-containing protein [Anaplasmataceae bacterium AB001_6]